jgi:hypothetical protein
MVLRDSDKMLVILWSYQLNTLFSALLSAILLVVRGSTLMFVSLKEGQTKIT